MGSWDSPFLSLYLRPNINAHVLFSVEDVCARRWSLINWVLILIPSFFPLNLKTGARLFLELDAILKGF